MDQVLSKAGFLCAEESTTSAVNSCHTTYIRTLTQTFACTSTQTLKLGTIFFFIFIVTQHYRFDYHCVRAGIACCTIHLLREAPFINISSIIATHTHTTHTHTHWNPIL